MAFKSIFNSSLKYVHIIDVTQNDKVKQFVAKVGHVSNFRNGIFAYIYHKNQSNVGKYSIWIVWLMKRIIM